MCPRTMLFRYGLVVTLMLISLPWVSGFSFQNYSAVPVGSEISAGTPVNAGFTLHFDSWDTGSTFDKDNLLRFNTDLTDAQWTMTTVEPMDDQPSIVQQLPARQGAQVKVDGWSLSFSRKKFDLLVQLTGTAPSRNQTGTITIIKLQEITPASKTVGSAIQKEKTLTVPTTVPTAAPPLDTVTMVPGEQIEVTPEQAAPVTTTVPTKKVTYSPGPGPLMIAGLLAGLVLLASCTKRRE
jgi:hypothetical protein